MHLSYSISSGPFLSSEIGNGPEREPELENVLICLILGSVSLFCTVDVV